MGKAGKAIAALWWALWPGLAAAQAGEPQESAIGNLLKSLDQGFGATVVAPLAHVLFFDLAFWDNGAPTSSSCPSSSSG